MFRHRSLIICLALLGMLFLNTAAEAQKSMTVQVQEGQLRATPSLETSVRCGRERTGMDAWQRSDR